LRTNGSSEWKGCGGAGTVPDGLLSVADALLDKQMERVLEELPLSAEVAVMLRGGESEFRGVYDLMLAYERGR